MIKVLIWNVFNNVSYEAEALRILEVQYNGIEIVGRLSGDCRLNDTTKFDVRSYDVILAVGAGFLKMARVTEKARLLHLPESKLLRDSVVIFSGFKLDKYRQLQNLHMSIFSMECSGAMLQASMGLPFYSPLIGTLFNEKNYLSFLRNPRTYIDSELVYYGNHKDGAPIARLRDITIKFAHSKNFEESVAAWKRRKQRINWDNLFVSMYTEDKKIAKQFDELPFAKKVCFMPFKSEDLLSAWYINPNIDKEAQNFGDVIRRSVSGKFSSYYDWFDMLLYGKKTQLIDM